MTWTNTVFKLVDGIDAVDPPVALQIMAEGTSRVLLSHINDMQLAMDVQDSLDIARVTTEEELLSLRCAAAEVQKSMRQIQANYVKQYDKPTVAERQYKIDPSHAQLEMLQSKLQAHILYAEGLLKAVDDKSFKLGTLMKGLV